MHLRICRSSQSSGGVLKKRYSWKFCKIHRKTLATLLKKSLWYGCFPVNFEKFLRISFLQNTSDGCFRNWHFNVMKFFDLYNAYFNQKQTEAVARRCSVKKVFEKISPNSLKNLCARVSFLIKSQAKASNFIKRVSGTGVFLWILRNY